jgi:hypothetical protein
LSFLVDWQERARGGDEDDYEIIRLGGAGAEQQSADEREQAEGVMAVFDFHGR